MFCGLQVGVAPHFVPLFVTMFCGSGSLWVSLNAIAWKSSMTTWNLNIKLICFSEKLISIKTKTIEKCILLHFSAAVMQNFSKIWCLHLFRLGPGYLGRNFSILCLYLRYFLCSFLVRKTVPGCTLFPGTIQDMSEILEDGPWIMEMLQYFH